MRKLFALGVMGLMVALAAAMVARAQDAPGGPERWQGPPAGQHQFGEGGHHQFGEGGHHQFGMEGREGGFERERMGGQRGRHGFALLRLADNPRMRAELNLTDAQVGRLHALAVESEKSSIKTRADLELHGIELRELLRADNPDHDAIMNKVQAISDLRGQMAKQHMETMLTARSVLTPEQLKKMHSLMENRGFGGRGGPGGPEREHMMEHRGGQGRPPGRPGAGPGAPATSPAHTTNPPNQ